MDKFLTPFKRGPDWMRAREAELKAANTVVGKLSALISKLQKDKKYNYGDIIDKYRHILSILQGHVKSLTTMLKDPYDRTTAQQEDIVLASLRRVVDEATEALDQAKAASDARRNNPHARLNFELQVSPLPAGGIDIGRTLSNNSVSNFVSPAGQMMYGGTAEGNAQTAMWEEDPLPIVRVHARDPMFSRIDLDSLLTNIDAALILHVMTRFINATREGSESRRALSHHEFMEFLWNHSTALTQGGHLFNVRPFRGIVRSLSDDRSMTLLGQLRSALQATRDPTILFYRALRFHAGGAVDAGQNYRNVHASMVFRAIQRSEANDHATLSREIIRSLLQPFVDAGIDMQHIHSLGLSPNDLASTLNSAADVVHSHDPFQVYSVFMEIVAEKRRQSSGSQVSGSTGQGRSSGSRHSGSYNSHDRLFK